MHIKNFKNLLGKGLTEPPPQTPPPISLGASCLGARIVRTRRFAPRGTGARFARTRRFASPCELCSHIQHFHLSRINPAYATESSKFYFYSVRESVHIISFLAHLQYFTQIIVLLLLLLYLQYFLFNWTWTQLPLWRIFKDTPPIFRQNEAFSRKSFYVTFY